MERLNQQMRVAFARQPARILLVDFSPPFTHEICQHLHQALEHTLALVCNMTGPCRVPFFGLFALASHSENLFPLQHVRGNFPRLQNALHELRSFQRRRDPNRPAADQKGPSLSQALQDAVSQFKRQSQTLRQTTNFHSQLEVIIVTCQQGGLVAKQLEKVLTDLDLESLRKIQVLSVFNPEVVSLPDEETASSSQQSSSTTSSSTTTGENLLNCGVIDVTTIEPDEVSFQNFFAGWFHDCGTDKEHMHLLFPSGGMSSGKLVLKCDLHERFISPGLLPFQAQFQLTSDNPVQSKPPTQGQLSANQTVPIWKLRVMQLVKIEGVCDSVVFGQPAVAKPTSCWKLDWEELDSNQQHFHALCHLLHSKQMGLLTRLEPADMSSGHPYTSHSPSTLPKPRGHFIVLPSPTSSLLIKPVAVSELMLPSDSQAKMEKPVSDSVAVVSEYLDQLDVLESYNPLLTRSNLTSSLVGLLTRNSAMTRQPRRGRQAAATSVQSAFNQPSSGRGRPRGRGRGASNQQPSHPTPNSHQFQTASQLMAGPSSKRFCSLPMEGDIYDFEY